MNAPVEANTYVTVIGEVIAFDSAEVAKRAKDYTVDISPETAAKFKGRPVIFATNVINTAGTDLALRLPAADDRRGAGAAEGDEGHRAGQRRAAGRRRQDGREPREGARRRLEDRRSRKPRRSGKAKGKTDAVADGGRCAQTRRRRSSWTRPPLKWDDASRAPPARSTRSAAPATASIVNGSTTARSASRCAPTGTQVVRCHVSHYDAGVPATLAPYPDRTLSTTSPTRRATRPHSPALLFKGATITYGELERLSDACAAAFAALGVQRGDRVALLLPNCPQFFIAAVRRLEARRDRRAAEPDLHRARARRPLREHGVETIVTLTRFYERVKPCSRGRRVRRVIATNIKEYFPPLLRAAVHAVAREARRRSHHARSRAITTSRTCCSSTAAASRPTRRRRAGRSGGPADERRHDRHAERRARHARRVRHRRDCRSGVERVGAARRRRTSSSLPLPLFHVYAQRRRQALAFIDRQLRWRSCRTRATSPICWRRSAA